MSKNEQNNGLYIVIIILVWIMMGWIGYFYGQKNSWNIIDETNNWTMEVIDNTDDTNNWTIEVVDNTDNTKYTPMVEEAWRIGLDKEKIQECIDENKFLTKINSQMKVWSDNFGITWTPGNVLINNETWEYVVISWAHPKESFIKNIDDLLSNNIVKENLNISTKDFVKNTDDNTIVVISDKRDLNSGTDLIILELKKVEAIKTMNIIEYSFSDNWVKEYLEENKIKALPLIVFPKAKIDASMNSFLIELYENAYSLNIWAKFNPFQELSENDLK